MLEFHARVAERNFDLELTVETGETLAILGPNGAGKSTLLDLIAGLLRPDSGSLRLDGRTLFEIDSSGSGVVLAPHARGISLLAQQPLLFPRMTVLDNVAFGPRSARVGRQKSRDIAAHWLDEVDASEFARRRPAQLSGGQAQRIAVARALAATPKLLLLDEPLAALDITVTPALRRTLRRVLSGKTTILVTHDVLDAFTLADRVAVIRDGMIVEIGATRSVFERPRTTFTAALVGLNLVTGIRTRSGFRTRDGGDLRAATHEVIDEGVEVGATIAPTALRLSLDRDPDTTRQSIAGMVADLEPRGDLIRVSTEHLFADVPPSAAADLDLIPGTRVWISYDPGDLTLYRLQTPAANRLRLFVCAELSG